MMSENSVDIAILTVIPPELAAARTALDIPNSARKKDQGGTVYFRSKIHSNLKNQDYDIVLTCIGGAGNPNAAAATTEVIEKYQPRTVLLMGIAAGIRGKMRIGEVAISERIVAYEPAALTRSSEGIPIIEPRPEIYRWTHTINQDVVVYQADEPEPRIGVLFEEIFGDDSYPEPPEGKEKEFEHVANAIAVKISTIAAGEKLLRNPDKLQEVRKIQGKTEVGEMEAAGVVEACRRGNVNWLVIRGISDFGDNFKDDRFHKFASQTAAAVLADFLIYGLDLGDEEGSPSNIPTYLNSVIQNWQNLQSPLLPMGVALSTIAVRLKLMQSESNKRGIFPGVRRPKLPGYHKKGYKDSLAHSAVLSEFLDSSPKNERWLILGDPGTGKSTLLLRESERLATRALSEPLEPVPILFPLAPLGLQVGRNFRYSIYDHIDSIGQNLDLPGLGQEFRELAQEGRVIFLLDGLDEVPDNTRSTVIERIVAAIPSNVGNRIVLTSRKVGVSVPAGFTLLEIEPLNIDEQRKLMIAICGEEKTAMLLRNLAGRRDLQDMAGVPMLLTVLALVANDTGDDFTDTLQRRTDLFKVGEQILLEGRHKGNQGVINTDSAELILARASLILHSTTQDKQNSETFTVSELQSAIETAEKEWLSHWQGPRHFIQDVSVRSNLIYPTDNLQRSYRYLHRTFREFFAALELSRLSRDERMKIVNQLMQYQNWAEVMVLLGGLTSDVEAHLRQLLSVPSDLALRTLKEVKRLKPKLAIQVLQLEPSDLRARRQVFNQLSQKLRSPDQVVDVLRAYFEAMEADIPRADLYFIQEVLERYDLDIARDLIDRLFDYLPDVPECLFDSLTIQGKSLAYWCHVPAGKCLIGGAPDDPERPPWVLEWTEIEISDFEIGRVPVTNKIYEMFDPSHREWRDFQYDVPPEELEEHPVVNVSWYEAEVFCRWLRQIYPNIRIPTESEWEKAASWSPDGRKRRFPWGDHWDPSLLNSWHKGPNRTTRVGTYLSCASPCGALDMAGNIWEWCSDWFEDDIQAYRSRLKANPHDPQGAEVGMRRVDRGGGWYHDVGIPCTFLRAADDPADIFSHCGFRLVRKRL